MSLRGNTLFADKDLATFLNERQEAMADKIKHMRAVDFEGGTVDELCDAVTAEWTLEVPSLKGDRMETGHNRVTKKGDALGSIIGAGSEKELVEITAGIPVSGVMDLLFCKSSMSSGKSAPPAVVEDGKLILTYQAKDESDQAWKSQLDQDLKGIKKALKRVGREVAEWNESLRDEVLRHLRSRGTRFLDAKAFKGVSRDKVTGKPKGDDAFDPRFGMVSFVPGGWAEEEKQEGPEVKEGEKPEPEGAAPLEEGAAMKYIVDLDLKSYSDISANLEQSLGAQAIQVLNKQIQGFVTESLRELGLDIDRLPVARTGDGAILAFDDADTAVRFGAGVHFAADRHNAGKTEDIAMRLFRVGVAKGEIVLEKELTPGGDLKGYSMSGTAISKAVRLESAAGVGEVMVCVDTFDDLSDGLAARFGEVETISGKRDERFDVRRWRAVEF